MSLRDQLGAIYKAHDYLTPKLVVDVARAEDHPLHDRFEWDNGIAGEKYRQVQAGELLRSVKITVVERGDGFKSFTVNAFHSVPTPDGCSYKPTEVVAADPFSRQLVLAAAEREWKALRRRYAHLSEFLTLVRSDVDVDGIAS